ncbi:hypothetical protein RU07_08765 [Agrobacterium tumefaciens]|uniref:Uncharacterized protein n=1 Tax=Agrobacterium tumefaciens TaxID=358 RepID=A0A0D0KW88_AGRTU|nr:hypothetical protein RU07_08765 [Agrobacterium tumefaciens]
MRSGFGGERRNTNYLCRFLNIMATNGRNDGKKMAEAMMTAGNRPGKASHNIHATHVSASPDALDTEEN